MNRPNFDRLTVKGWVGAVLASAMLAGQGAVADECALDVIDIRGGAGQVRFNITIADEPEEQAKGLMFVESMPRFDGMLFVYDPPIHATFWMKNTPLSLDMLFFDADGRLQHVHHEAVPLSEDVIDGGTGISGILEINGGMARQLGLLPGAVARHPSFTGDDPAWPCPAE